MRKRIVMIICVMVMIITAMPIYAVSFSDLDQGHWAYNNIIKFAEQGIVNGYEDGTFRPENMVTYGEFMKLVMCTYFTENKINTNDSSHWALKYVRTAEFRGLIPLGFVSLEKLDKPIDRINMVKLVALMDTKLTNKAYKKTRELDFVDIGGLPDEYIGYLERVVNRGYILGNPDKKFKPTDNLSRAEMVTILIRIQGGGVNG